MDVRLPDGTIIQGVPDGISKAELVSKLQGNGMAVPSEWLQQSPTPSATQEAGKAVNSGMSDIPRQLGLTARYALEGPAQAAQIFTEPVAGLMRSAGIPTKSLGQIATGLADRLGLPNPQTPYERVIGDTTRLVAGGGATMGAASAASRLPGIAGTVGAGLAANPGQQTGAAVGAGMLGGLSREGGGSEGQQLAASLIGGLAGGGAVGAGQWAGQKASNIANRVMGGFSPQALDVQISNTLANAGVDYSQVPERVRQSLRAEMQQALSTGGEVRPDALRRLADFQALGVTPTRGMISQDPVQITREMNLAKMGANSGNGELQGLARIQNQNNTRLIDVMNEAGAGRGDTLRAGEAVTSSILGRQAGLRNAETAAWDAARSSPGYRQPISSRVISDINQTLGDEGLMPFMSPQISRYMEAFQTGQPFTPQDYRNLQSMLSREMAKGGNEGAAAGAAARVLRNADVQPITNPRGIDFGSAVVTPEVAQRLRTMDAAPQSAIDAVNQARGATRAAYAYEDSSPLVRSVLSDGASADPARIAQRFVIGGTPNEARTVAQEVGPNGLPVIRDALLDHLKSKALNGASDEIGKFSQSAFNKELNKIGERKLSVFFSPEEIEGLRRTGRVASYMQNQPAGSAVNNSNTAGALLGRGIDVLNKVPVIGPMVGPAAQNIRVAVQQRAAQNLTPGLLAPMQRPGLLQGMATPSIALGGLLAAPPLE